MSTSGRGKRKYEERFNQNNSKKPMDNRKEYEIITRVQSHEGVRGRLVIFENTLDMPYCVLQNAIDRINAVLSIKNTNNTGEYQLAIDNEVFAEGKFESLTTARKHLSELALANLKKTCFTIFRKVHPRHSPQIDLSLASTSAAPRTEMLAAQPSGNIGGIGAKMMQQMGWSGGGLGAHEQGRTNLILPYLQIHRQGLGSKNIAQEVTKVLQNYATSRDLNSIAFSPEFTKEERTVIHQVARKLNLKSRSYGKGADRVLVIQSKVRPWDLVHSLLEAGGENEQLKLFIPTDYEIDTSS